MRWRERIVDELYENSIGDGGGAWRGAQRRHQLCSFSQRELTPSRGDGNFARGFVSII